MLDSEINSVVDSMIGRFNKAALVFVITMLGAANAWSQVTQADVAQEPERSNQQTADSDQAETDSSDASPRPIEEITVNANSNILALRFRLQEAEDSMYAKFNELNSRDEFDVDCRVIRHTRSHIAERNCEPKFLTRERQSNVMQVVSQLRDGGVPSGGGLAGAAVNGGGSDGATSLNLEAIDNYQQGDAELRQLLSKKFEEMSEDMFRIASENPEFLQALMRVENFRRALTEAREERFGN